MRWRIGTRKRAFGSRVFRRSARRLGLRRSTTFSDALLSASLGLFGGLLLSLRRARCRIEESIAIGKRCTGLPRCSRQPGSRARVPSPRSPRTLMTSTRPAPIAPRYFGRRRVDERVERDGLQITFYGWAYPLEEYGRSFEDAGLLIESLREPT